MNMNWSGGDWMCGVCEHVNFKKREACQRCGYPKYGGPDPSTYDQYNIIHSKSTDEVLAGDWYCNCGAHNYASRSSCYRCNSNAYKSLDIGALPGWKSGDWICSRYLYLHTLTLSLPTTYYLSIMFFDFHRLSTFTVLDMIVFSR